METACLKIKFTSLIKKLRKDDSRSFLEIVPEVTCLQNVDKILWKQDNNLYEYVIPMTYKIILKKHRKYDSRCTSYELNQVYHSCVDILHAATTSSVYANGDIKRTFSETFLLNKLPEKFYKWNRILSQPEKTNSKPEDKITASVQTYEKRDEFILTSNENSNVNKNNSTSSKDSEKQYCVTHNNIDVQVDSLENIMKMVKSIVERGTRKCCNKKIDSLMNEISKKTNIDEMQKLSLTPICSINTNDTLLAQNENNYNSIIKYNNACYNDVVLYNYLAPIINPNIGANYKPLEELKRLQPYYRYTPEVRIAKFIQLIEYEMLPLKCMLNDIVSKYASLNVDSQLKKSLLRTKKLNHFEECRYQNRRKSNRVIYTIVFDG